MKRISFLMFMFSVCLLLTQCRKPVFPNMGEERTISFTTNSGDSKGDLEHNGSSFIYKWNTTDKVYVYASVSGSFGASNSQFCGVLDFDTDKYSSSEPTKGYFKGNVKMPEGMTGASKLRFFHFGSGVNPTITGNEGNQTCTANVDFAAQNGLLTGDGSVSSKIIAMSRAVAYSEDGSYSGDDCKLVAQFAVGVFTLDKFAGDVTVKKETGVNYTGLCVDQYGVLTQTSGTSMVVDYRMGNSYIAFVPDPAASKTTTTYTFETAARISKVTMDVLAGKFLSLGGNGDPVELNPLIQGSLPGKFSVSATKQVYFSQGNLWYGPKTTGAASTWNFEDNQVTSPPYTHTDYDYWDPTHKCHFCYTPNMNEAYNTSVSGGSTGDILFTNGQTTATKDNPNLEFTVNGVTGKYRVLSKDEWVYLFGRKNLNNQNLYACVTIDGIKGLVILPDGCETAAGTITSVTALNNNNAVFLPAGGLRNSGYNTGYLTNRTTYLYYWTSTPSDTWETTAHSWSYNTSLVYDVQYSWRSAGKSIRLVTDVTVDGNGSADSFGSGTW